MKTNKLVRYINRNKDTSLNIKLDRKVQIPLLKYRDGLSSLQGVTIHETNFDSSTTLRQRHSNNVDHHHATRHAIKFLKAEVEIFTTMMTMSLNSIRVVYLPPTQNHTIVIVIR